MGITVENETGQQRLMRQRAEHLQEQANLADDNGHVPGLIDRPQQSPAEVAAPEQGDNLAILVSELTALAEQVAEQRYDGIAGHQQVDLAGNTYNEGSIDDGYAAEAKEFLKDLENIKDEPALLERAKEFAQSVDRHSGGGNGTMDMKYMDGVSNRINDVVSKIEAVVSQPELTAPTVEAPSAPVQPGVATIVPVAPVQAPPSEDVKNPSIQIHGGVKGLGTEIVSRDLMGRPQETIRLGGGYSLEGTVSFEGAGMHEGQVYFEMVIDKNDGQPTSIYMSKDDATTLLEQYGGEGGEAMINDLNERAVGVEKIHSITYEAFDHAPATAPDQVSQTSQAPAARNLSPVQERLLARRAEQVEEYRGQAGPDGRVPGIADKPDVAVSERPGGGRPKTWPVQNGAPAPESNIREVENGDLSTGFNGAEEVRLENDMGRSFFDGDPATDPSIIEQTVEFNEAGNQATVTEVTTSGWTIEP